MRHQPGRFLETLIGAQIEGLRRAAPGGWTAPLPRGILPPMATPKTDVPIETAQRALIRARANGAVRDLQPLVHRAMDHLAERVDNNEWRAIKLTLELFAPTSRDMLTQPLMGMRLETEEDVVAAADALTLAGMEGKLPLTQVTKAQRTLLNLLDIKAAARVRDIEHRLDVLEGRQQRASRQQLSGVEIPAWLLAEDADVVEEPTDEELAASIFD